MMKATGIVRRIDDLGRVVIPREIRRNLRIREGDPLEIFIDEDGGVIFKKYSVLHSLQDYGKQMCDTLHKMTGMTAIFTDRDEVLDITGTGRRELLGHNLSDDFSFTMGSYRLYVYDGEAKTISVCDYDTYAELYHVSVCVPIYNNGELLGAIALVSAEDIVVDDATVKIAQTAADFLSRLSEG